MAKAKTLILVAAWMESDLVYVVVPAAGVLGVVAFHVAVVLPVIALYAVQVPWQWFALLDRSNQYKPFSK
jgi:hypothetical protein